MRTSIWRQLGDAPSRAGIPCPQSKPGNRATIGSDPSRRWPRHIRVLAVLAACGCALSLNAQAKKEAPKPAAAQQTTLGPGEYAVFNTSKGTFVVQLFPKDAPQSVANFVALAEGKHPYKNPYTGGLSMNKLYNGLLFFRSIPGYLIQTGDPENNGLGRVGYSIPYEKNNLKFDQPGRMALAQAEGDPTSRGSQVFFTLKAVPDLNSKGFLIIGQIVQGLDVADALSQGPRKPGQNDVPQFPPILNSVTIKTVP